MKNRSFVMGVALLLVSSFIFPGFIKRRAQVEQCKQIAVFNGVSCSARLSESNGVYFLECDITKGWCKGQASTWFERHGKDFILTRSCQRILNIRNTFVPEFMDNTSMKNIKANMIKLLNNKSIDSVEQFVALSVIKVRVHGYLFCSKSKDACYAKFVEIFGKEALNQLRTIN